MSVLVLCYHRVNILESDVNKLSVTPTNFYQQMLYLKNNYNILRFNDDWTSKEGRNVVVTFDDGYEDNYINAVPILENLGIPATFFVATAGIGKKYEFWWDELENILLIGYDFPKQFTLVDEKLGCTFDTSTYELRLNCYYSLHHLMKNFIDVKRRNNWMEQLWKWKDDKKIYRLSHKVISEQMCIEISNNPLFDIGAHTVNHPSLGNMDKVEQNKEIEESVKILSDIVSKKIDLFSYPFGINGIDYNGDTIDICKNCGIKKVAAAYSGLWNESFGLYDIPRVGVRNLNLFDYKEKLESIS